MSKNLDALSPSLKRGIRLYVERLDLDTRYRDLLYDIIRFAYDEGKISGKEDFLKEHQEFINQTNNDGETEQI